MAVEPKKKPKQKKKAGQPTKYKPEYCKKLMEHMAQGFSYESFVSVTKVSLDTMYRWEKQNPEYFEAKKIAIGMSRYFWEQAGINGL